jgi:murein L,D-transpeptidase YcbB/YkuD
LLDAAAAAPDLAQHLGTALAVNPLYAALSRGYARRRSASPRLTAAEDATIRANLDRARVIPALPGRYVIVDAGSARLWMIDGRKVEGPMRVIVGKPDMQTPAMAGLIRYVTLNPWWNVPPDLARERAKRVLNSGPGLLQRERMELLSDWSDSPQVISASEVDWKAVASGRATLRMRQRPGRENVMGAMKFMLPNRLGIYLHDFPDKSLFARSDRRLSSGCVRLADAPRLARFLFGGAAPRPAGVAPEQRVDLPEPVPVYITYLTALPDPARGIALQKDVYARDLRRPAGRRA